MLRCKVLSPQWRMALITAEMSGTPPGIMGAGSEVGTRAPVQRGP